MIGPRIVAIWMALVAGAASADTGAIGIVVMHGKGGSPTKHVAPLAGGLETNGYRVANIEMPWAGRRGYDIDTAGAEREVRAALAMLRERGAQKVFVAGHSQGGAFALHFAGVERVDGIIAIAPGGSTGSALFREKLGDVVERAQRLMAEGKGDEAAALSDFESSKGLLPITTTPAVYLTWFEPNGVMNMQRAARAARPDVPILWIVARNDYPGLRKTNLPLFQALPAHPLTRLYEPNADHLGAPAASLEEIVRWITAVVAGKNP